MAKVFGLILLLLLLMAIAMMNYSLAVLLALTLTIPAVVALPCGIRSVFECMTDFRILSLCVYSNSARQPGYMHTVQWESKLFNNVSFEKAYYTIEVNFPSLWGLQESSVFSSSSGRGRQLLRIVCTFLFSPPLCLLYLCCAYAFLTSSTAGASLSDLVSAGLERAVEGTVFAYNSWYLVGSWLYLVSCLFVWPVWLMSWILCCQSARKDIGSTNSDPHPHSD